MMHLTYAGKDLLTGDDVAELLVDYAALLARTSDADAVVVAAYDATGSAVRAKFMLSNGSPIIVETSSSDLPAPDNASAVSYIEEQISRRAAPNFARLVEDPLAPAVLDDMDAYP